MRPFPSLEGVYTEGVHCAGHKGHRGRKLENMVNPKALCFWHLTTLVTFSDQGM